MRIHELIETTNPLPDLVYHGTASKNLSKIMRNGLKPKLNKWFYSNNYQSGANGPYRLQPGEKLKDLADLSTTPDFEKALAYAKQGGSTGWGDTPGVVLAFKPLPTDIIVFGGFEEHELVFKNVIAPERLEIVWPERLKSKKEELLAKASEKKAFGATKTDQVKAINKQLKAVNSEFRIKSLSPTTPRVAIILSLDNPLSYIFRGQESFDRGTRTIVNTNIDSHEFNNWLKQALTTHFTPTKYDELHQYVRNFFPNSTN